MTNSPIFRVTPKAYADLQAIARYTRKTWGREQSAEYLRKISQRFEWLSQSPARGRSRPDVAPGYHCYPQGAHLIFYLIVEHGIDIIGVPHQSMDTGKYFDPDHERR